MKEKQPGKQDAASSKEAQAATVDPFDLSEKEKTAKTGSKKAKEDAGATRVITPANKEKKDAQDAPAPKDSALADDATRVQAPVKAAEKPAPKKKKARKRTVVKVMVLNLFKAIFVCFCIAVIVLSLVVVQMVQYVVDATNEDDNILDLENMKLKQTSYFMAANPDNPNAREEDDWFIYQELSGSEHRIWVPLNEIPDNLVNAVVATEDRAFYEHHGVNFERTAYALLNEVFQFQSNTFGASTIDQQLVKNLTGEDQVVGEDGDKSEGYRRKLREIFRAWGLNNRYSKDMIMEAYLNTMSLSETVAGVEAGAQVYFGKSVSELTLAECATVAGITRAPTYYSPYQNPENCHERRDDVLFFMFETGKITEKEFNDALDEPFVIQPKNAPSKNENADGAVFSYVSDKVFDDVVADLMVLKNCTYNEAVEDLRTGGYRVYITADLRVQAALDGIYDTGYDEDGYFMDESRFPGYARRMTVSEDILNDQDLKVGERQVMPQSSCAVINYEGELVAIRGGIGKKTESLSLNRAVGTVDEDGNPQGALRQVGSTMKPIAAYALGIDYGIITYSKGVMDVGVRNNPGSPRATDAEGNPVNNWPRNYSGTYRNYPLPICSAITESTNTVAAQVGMWVGVDSMYSFLTQTLQISSLVEPYDLDLGPLVLGSMTHGMCAYELAGAYMMFGGNDTYGTYNSLHSYLRIEDSRGNIVMKPEQTTVQAIDPQSGYVMNRLLSNVLRGSGMPGGAAATAGGMSPVGEMDSVAKTGTTSDDIDRWFVGLTPYYVTAVWWGYDNDGIKDPADRHDLSAWSPGARTNIPVNVWKTLMEDVQEEMPVKEFPAQPDGIVEDTFCTISGDLASAGCPGMRGYYTSFNIPDHCAVAHGGEEEAAAA